MNKRELMIGGGIMALGASLARAASPGPVGETHAIGARRRLRPAALEGPVPAAVWSQYLGDEFAAPGGLRLRLHRIEDHSGNDAALAQFTLHFAVIAGAASRAATLHLRHRSGQRVDLYLEPLTDAAGGTAAQAHFSLLA
jgi:hypothetical protein